MSFEIARKCIDEVAENRKYSRVKKLIVNEFLVTTNSTNTKFDITDPQLVWDYCNQVPALTTPLFSSLVIVFNRIARLTAEQHRGQLIDLDLSIDKKFKYGEILSDIDNGEFSVKLNGNTSHIHSHTIFYQFPIKLFPRVRNSKISITNYIAEPLDLEIAELSVDSKIFVQHNSVSIGRYVLGNNSTDSEFRFMGLSNNVSVRQGEFARNTTFTIN